MEVDAPLSCKFCRNFYGFFVIMLDIVVKKC